MIVSPAEPGAAAHQHQARGGHIEGASTTLVNALQQRNWTTVRTLCASCWPATKGGTNEAIEGRTTTAQRNIDTGVEREFALFMERFDAIQPREHILPAIGWPLFPNRYSEITNLKVSR